MDTQKEAMDRLGTGAVKEEGTMDNLRTEMDKEEDSMDTVKDAMDRLGTGTVKEEDTIGITVEEDSITEDNMDTAEVAGDSSLQAKRGLWLQTGSSQ